MVDFGKPDEKVLARLSTATDEGLKNYAENAQRHLPETQWLLDAVGKEQIKRGGAKNFTPQAVCKILIGAAREGKIRTYKEVTDEFGIDWPKVHRIIPHHLGEISTAEHNAGRPLLSAIVVEQGKKGLWRRLLHHVKKTRVQLFRAREI